jgi:hypothetical protein
MWFDAKQSKAQNISSSSAQLSSAQLQQTLLFPLKKLSKYQRFLLNG